MAEARRARVNTVRVRVTMAAAIVVSAVLVLVSVLLVTLQRSALTDQVDDALSAQAERIADAFGVTGAIPGGIDEDLLVLVVDADGRVVASSGDADELAMLAPDVGAGAVTVDGEGYRVVSESIDTGTDDGDVHVIVAGALDDVDESIAELTSSLRWVIPLAVLVLIVVVWFVVGRTLRPVERIRAEVASIGVGELDRRVTVPGGGDEIARLALTMNDMLARLESAVRRQQQFVADASHELRTPLTRMRTELEVDERDPDRADPAATRRSQLDEIAVLQQMIEDLLVLARSDARTSTVGDDVIDLDDIVLDEARVAGPSAITVDTSNVSGAQVVGSRHELHRVVRNLMDNARRHARTTVRVELVERTADACLIVSDDGPGIAPADRERALERFTRLDESRTGGAGRSGLGLAIVDDIVTRHGGSTTIDDAPGGGARVTVTLPVTKGASRVPAVG
ncbi:MAG: HAMP domain-containing sensor histidine kinase [Ilumatobacteraceae bacterium]